MDIERMGAREDEEEKDASSASLLDDGTILSIVDEPYSSGDIERHKEQSLPISFYEKMMGVSSGGNRSKGKKGRGGKRVHKNSNIMSSFFGSTRNATVDDRSVTSGDPSITKPPLPVITVPMNPSKEQDSSPTTNDMPEGATMSQITFADSFAAARESMSLSSSSQLPPSPSSAASPQGEVIRPRRKATAPTLMRRAPTIAEARQVSPTHV